MIAEGNAFYSTRVNSTDPDTDPLSYSWDLNGDGSFGVAVGANPLLSWAQLVTLDIFDSGIYGARIRVIDGQGGMTTSTAASLTIGSVALVTSITSPMIQLPATKLANSFSILSSGARIQTSSCTISEKI